MQAPTSNDHRFLRLLSLSCLLIAGGCQGRDWAMGLSDSPQGELPKEGSPEQSEKAPSEQPEAGPQDSESESPDSAAKKEPSEAGAEDPSDEDQPEPEASPESDCGNGIVEPPEACDDANEIDSDDCLSNCQLPRCGDGVIWEGHEECEAEQEDLRPRCKDALPEDILLHNPDSPLGCDSKCRLVREHCAYCGDDVVQKQFGERCEDTLACNDPRIDARYYDSEKILAQCAPDCRSIDASDCGYCGDGVVQEWAQERCDDANSSTSDSCPQCQPARCGDGFVWAGQEECDPGSAASATQVSTCAEICGEFSEPILEALPPSRKCKQEGEEACEWGSWDCRGCRAP